MRATAKISSRVSWKRKGQKWIEQQQNLIHRKAGNGAENFFSFREEFEELCKISPMLTINSEYV